MSSYTRAKAEAMRIVLPRGLMRRHERTVYLIIAAAFTRVLGPIAFAVGLGVVAVNGNTRR